MPLTPSSAASIPLTVDDKGEQRVPTNPPNLHVLRLPPLANQYYGYVFPVKWDDLYISGQYLTGDFGYRVLNKRVISRN